MPVAVNRKRLPKRKQGVFYTPTELFDKYIYPEISDILWDYTWVDLFCGRGDLIIPLLLHIECQERTAFFADHIRCFDVSPMALKELAKRLREIGITDEDLIKKNLIQTDTLIRFPEFEHDFPLFHITNPPYLYKGFIPKTKETSELLRYFRGEREPLQDLYQVALFNDVKAGLQRMIYVIPANFLYGDAVSNYIRGIVLKHYRLRKVVVFERKIFQDTDINVCICSFVRKSVPDERPQVISAIKVTWQGEKIRAYVLSKKYKWRAGSEFYEIVSKMRARQPLNVKLYLTRKDIERHPGDYEVTVLDVNNYKPIKIHVSKALAERIRKNILFLKTLDTGSIEGRAGLYRHRDVFGVEGLLVTRAFTYRTHPIQVFFEDDIEPEEQIFVEMWFNSLLEILRARLDSDFMTTYRQTTRHYTRKYLGLKQAILIMETCPLKDLRPEIRAWIKDSIRKGDHEAVKRWIQEIINEKVSEISGELLKGNNYNTQTTISDFLSNTRRLISGKDYTFT